MKRQYALAFWLFLFVATPALSQQTSTSPNIQTQQQEVPPGKQGGEDVVRITTNLVQVDAVVTDKDGKPISDLKPEEVQVYEDGRPQKITHFSYMAAGTGESSMEAKIDAADKNTPINKPRPEDVRRTIALVIDDLGLSAESIYSVRRALKKFIDEQMRPGDLVAIIRTSGGVGALQQFTLDKRQLYAAIDHVKWNGLGRGGIGTFAPIEPPPPGGAMVEAANDELNRFREDLFAVGTLGAVSYVVKGLRNLPGRKSVLLISDGFRIYNSEDATRSYLALGRLRRLIDEANRASVVIYTLNATRIQMLGLTAEDSVSERSREDIVQHLNDRRAAAFETQEGLDFLAAETGGIAIRNTNDLSGGIRRVMDDQKGYYLIGYRPDDSTFDAKTGRRMFHKLNLKVMRPGKFNVRMRNGFFGVADAEAGLPSHTPQEQVTDALLSPFGASGVHVQLTSLFANDSKIGSFMRSILYVDAKDLTFTEEQDGWHRATFDVVAVTFDDNGRVIDQVSRTDALKVRGEGYQQVLRYGFVYFMILPIKKPGAYQLRAVLRDHDSERIGSASQFVEIPDLKKDRLALSGVLVSATNSADLRKAMSGASGMDSQDGLQNNVGLGSEPPKTDQAATTQKGEAARQSDPQASEAVRRFHINMLMRYSLVIYNAHLDKTTHLPQLQIQARLYRGGQPVFTGKVQQFNLDNPPDLSRLVADGAIKLGTDMVPGEYLLQVIVKDLLASEKHSTVTEWMDFEIVK